MARREYCADFETTTLEDDCRVWAWGLAEVGHDPAGTFEHGTDIDSFMARAFELGGRIWFHNLKFDGSFIMVWLLSHGWKHTEARRLGAGEFSAVIDNLGKIYQIKTNAVIFADSLKKITMSVRAVAETYGLEMTKGDLDYETFRPVGHELTPAELDYLSRDVLIMAQAMAERLEMGGRLTTSSDCLETFRDMKGRTYRAIFPVINPKIDAEMRHAYRGGWVYVNPTHKGKTVGAGIRLDVNSLYPWAMRYNPLPYGAPRYFKGKPPEDATRPLWIASVCITARLKPGKLPCIQTKGAGLFGDREYQTEIPEPLYLWVCSVDWELWNEMYDIDVWSWGGGWNFKSTGGIFDAYVDTFMEMKKGAKNPGERFSAKLRLNSLYGKLAQKIATVGKIPYLDEGVLHFKDGKESEREPVYLPAGIFITAYARRKTITTACEFGERFCYADTDSIHAIGEAIPPDVEVHPKKLGAWKLEAHFSRAKFLRCKTYVETVDGVEEYTCAGMAQSIKNIMRFEDFEPGFATLPCPYFMPGGCGGDCASCYNSSRLWGLRPKQVRGGVVLVPSPFSIK